MQYCLNNIIFNELSEYIKIFISSFFLLLIPQKCDNNYCNIEYFFNTNNNYLLSCLIFNFITFSSFSLLHYFEKKRESILSKYLIENKYKNMDHLKDEIKNLDINYQKEIYELNNKYIRLSLVSISIFFINLLLNSIFIFQKYISYLTVSVYLTNLFISSIRIHKIVLVISTNDHIFISSSFVNSVIYNDINSENINKIQNIATGLMFDYVPPPPVARNKLIEKSDSDSSIVSSNASTIDNKIPHSPAEKKMTHHYNELDYIV